VPQSIVYSESIQFTHLPMRAQHIWRMSDGSLVTAGVHGFGGGTVKRWRSGDNGATWVSLPPSTDIARSSLHLAQDGDIIYGLAVNGNGADIIKWVYAAGAFQDTKTAYTPTNAWNVYSINLGDAVADTVKSAAHIMFEASPDGGTTDYVYMIAIDKATAAKITELRFVITDTLGQSGDFRVDAQATPKLYLTYLDSTAKLIKYRSYTFNGSTYSAADGEETAYTGATIINELVTWLDAANLLEFAWGEATTTLKTRKRTGVGTYGAITTLTTSAADFGPDQFSLTVSEFGNANADVVLLLRDNTAASQMHYVKRIATAWGAVAALTSDARFYYDGSIIRRIGSDSRAHAVYSSSESPTVGYYDFVGAGSSPTATDVLPRGTNNLSATPVISATYVEALAGDNLLKYRVLVKRSSDSTVFWDTGAGGTAWGGAPVGPGDTFSIVYAGTALVKGTTYQIEISFWESVDSIAGALSSPIDFSWNDPPRAAAVSLAADTALAKMRVALYPLAPGASDLQPVLADIYRRISGATLWEFLTRVTFTAPTTQTGFAAYRQLPEKIARNLVINGGFVSGSHGWALHANASVVIDAASPSGYALRTIATGVDMSSSHDIPVEAGKAYSFAAQVRTDGGNGRVEVAWLDGAGATISIVVGSAVTVTVYTESVLANQTAPGNARTARIRFDNPGGAGVFFMTAVRLMQQAGAPAAWTSAHQQYVSRGLAIYEASTNLAADGDMEAVGTASYTATTATLSKDTTNPFAGAKRLKIVNTSANGRASQTGSLAAAQPISASVRCIGADAGAGIRLVSTPGGTTIASDLGASTTDYVVRKVAGVIAGGDTGWRVDLIGGSGAAVTSYFDNLAVENKAYDTMNADPSGQAFALAGRTVSDIRLQLPSAFDPTDFAFVAVVRPDVAYAVAKDYGILYTEVDANNSFALRLLKASGNGVSIVKVRSGVTLQLMTVAQGWNTGDTVAVAGKFRAGTGLTVFVSINGAAVSTAADATPEAQIAIVGAPTLLQLIGYSAQQLLGTIGVARILKGGLSDATISALVSDPYQQPTADDLAVWNFEGATLTVPSYDDRFVRLGKTYEYRADTTSATPPATMATGQISSGVVAALVDSFWLKHPDDDTFDLKLFPLYADKWAYDIPREATIVSPIGGGFKIAELAASRAGAEFGGIHCLWPTGSEATKLALEALQNAEDPLVLQDPFGASRRVVFAGSARYVEHPEGWLEATLPLVEVR
jgi:hypothetical protein